MQASDPEPITVDWDAWIDWMLETEPWGNETGQDIILDDYLKRWRRDVGDAEVLKALEHARAKGWYGLRLVELLEERVQWVLAKRNKRDAA